MSRALLAECALARVDARAQRVRTEIVCHREELLVGLRVLRGGEPVGEPTEEEFRRIIEWRDALRAHGMTIAEFGRLLEEGRIGGV